MWISFWLQHCVISKFCYCCRLFKQLRTNRTIFFRNFCPFGQGRQSTRDRGDATHQSLCWGGHQLHCPPPPKVEWRYRSLALLILGLNNVLFPYDFCEVQKAPKSTAAGLRPGPHWGSLQRSPRPTVMLVLGLGLKESLRTISWSLALALRTKSLALALKQSPWIGLVECGYNIAY